MKERQFELLTEEECKKKIVFIATAVLIFGFVIGSGLIAAGLLRMSHEQEEISERIERSGKLQSEMGAEDEDLPDLKKQRDDEYAKNGASDKYYQLDQKIADIDDDKHKKNEDYDDLD
jgi:cell division protein FtsB